MIRKRFTVFALIAAAPCVGRAGEPSKGVVIPLDTIWAGYMPGTKDIHTLEPDVFSSAASDLPANERDKLARDSMINRIAAKLQPAATTENGPTVTPNPRQAFAVVGNGRDALKAASEVFHKGEEPKQTFPVGTEISVVFFSYQAGTRVELVNVDVIGSTINIRYRFNADGLLMSSSHIALVPMGHLAVGEYQVTFTQSPLTGHSAGNSRGQIMKEWEDEVICQPFSFRVTE